MQLLVLSPEAVTVFGALIGAAFGASLGSFLSHRFSRNRDHLELKRDVLRRVMGFRWTLSLGRHSSEGQFFTALNEAAVVFAGDKDVEREIETFHRVLEGGFRAEHLRPLAEAMAGSARVPYRAWKKELLERPFTPPDYRRG